MDSFRTRAGLARRARRARGAQRRPAARLPAGPRPQAARRRHARAGELAGRPGARVGAAGARRPLPGARTARGSLDALLEQGYRWAFVSNADNLGATLDPRILAWIAARGRPVPHGGRRPHGGRPQGRPPRRSAAGGGGLVLREVAQTPEDDLDAFQDITRHRYFNTNTLWLDLERVAADLEGDGVIDLPMIVNRKTVDPARPVLAEGHPARDGDGRGDRELPRRPRAARAALAVPAGQDDRRPARRCAPTPTRLGDDARVALAAGRGRRAPLVAARPRALQARRRLRGALPARARRRCRAATR